MPTTAPPDLDPHVLTIGAYSTDQHQPPRLWRCLGRSTQDGKTRWHFENAGRPEDTRICRISSTWIATLHYLKQGDAE